MFASDPQVFLGTRYLTKLANDHVDSVNAGISSARTYRLEVDLHTTINTLLENMESFGKIKIIDSDANLPFSINIEQAQIPIERIITVNDIMRWAR